MSVVWALNPNPKLSLNLEAFILEPRDQEIQQWGGEVKWITEFKGWVDVTKLHSNWKLSQVGPWISEGSFHQIAQVD